MENQRINISEKIKLFSQNNTFDETKCSELTKIFEDKKYKQIIISKEALKEFRKIIGSTNNTSHLTDKEKLMFKNIRSKNTAPSNQEVPDQIDNKTDIQSTQPQKTQPILPQNSVVEKTNYDKKIEFRQSDLMDKSIAFGKTIDKKMPQNMKDFFDKYQTNSLVFAWNKSLSEDQSNHGWILNVWSHKYGAQLAATAVFEGLPKTMNENLRYAIATMIATATMYTKETQDINIYKEDITIPFFYDLWDGNKVFLTYAPGGSLSVDFKLSNIEALNNKAGKYLRYINGEIIQNSWDHKHTRDELRVDIGFGIQEGWDAHFTSVKSPDNISKYKGWKYDGSQVMIATYTDEILSAKVWSNWESILKWTLWMQKDKSGINGIYWVNSENKLSTDYGTFGLEAWVMQSKTVWGKIGWNYQLPDNGAKIEVSQTSNYLDTKTHIYTSGTKISGELPIGDIAIGANFHKWKASFNGEQYGENWQVFWLTAWFDTNGWNTPIKWRIKDALGWADLTIKGQISTDNNYGISGWINKNTLDLNYGGSLDIWRWNKYGFKDTSGNNISAYIEKDIISLFDVFNNSSINDAEKTKLLLDIKNKYNLQISENDIKTLGPINSLRAFAIANKDLVNNDLFLNLGLSLKGWKVIFPSDFLWQKNPDALTETIIKFSAWSRIWVLTSSEKIEVGSEIFAKLDVSFSENRSLEFLAYKDWTKIINRVSYIENISRWTDGNILWFVIVVENQNGLTWVWAGINNIEKSGTWDRFTFKAFQNWGFSLSWGSQSIVFGDSNSELSLNINTLIPTISTIITENIGNNVTNEDGETLASYENLFQSIVKNKEDRVLVKEIWEKLYTIGNEIWLEFESSFIYKLWNTQNLKQFHEWLEINTPFLLENKWKIRYVKLGIGSETNSKFDDVSKILEYSIDLSNPEKNLSEKNLEAKKYDFYFFTETPEEISKKIEASNTSLLNYIESNSEIFWDNKKYLLTAFKNIEVIGFESLTEVEKKWFIQLTLRLIKNWNIANLKHKRINIIDDSLFSFSISLNNGVKSVTLEKKILQNIWESKIDYSQKIDFEKLWISQNQFNELTQKLSSTEKQKILEALRDIGTLNIVKNNDLSLANEHLTKLWNSEMQGKKLTDLDESQIVFDQYWSNNGKLFLSENLVEDIKNGITPFKEILYIFNRAKLDDVGNLDNEIKTNFTTNEAKIIRLKRSSWENTFYEFRPTSNFSSENGIKKVRYDIFDHGNKKLENFEVELNKNEVFITIQNKKYSLWDEFFQENYRHILHALTGMEWYTKIWITKSIGGILSQMI